MQITIVSSFLIPLVLSIAIECLTALVAGFRGKYFFLTLVLVNMITNPPLNWIMSVARLLELPGGGYVLLFLEAAAVVTEWRLLVYAFPNGSKRYLSLSIAMNAASYLIGALILHS